MYEYGRTEIDVSRSATRPLPWRLDVQSTGGDRRLGGSYRWKTGEEEEAAADFGRRRLVADCVWM